MTDSDIQKRGRNARLKGAKFERQVVSLHKELGIEASKVPLSGQLWDHPGDVKIGVLGGLIGECKDLKKGLKTVERWLDCADIAFSNQFRKDPLVHMTWATYVRLISAVYQAEETDRAIGVTPREGDTHDRKDELKEELPERPELLPGDKQP